MFFKSNDKYNHDKKPTKPFAVWWKAIVMLKDLFEIVPLSMPGWIDHLSAEKLNAIQKKCTWIIH